PLALYLDPRALPPFPTRRSSDLLLRARAVVPREEVLLRIPVDEARYVGGIDDDGALLFQDGDRVGHRFRLFGVETASGRRFTGNGDAVVVERARDADARALQRVGPQELRVVAPRRRR